MKAHNFKRLNRAIAAATLSLATSLASAATVVFSDDFNDGNVSDWSVAGNVGNPVVTVRSDSVVSPGFALFTYFDAPPGGTNLIVRASHDFVAPVAGDYLLELWARSSPCSGCTMSYDVIVDGVSLDRKFQQDSFESRSFALTNLTAGTHTLTLGMHTTNASSGRFNASFDDVVISTTAPVPEPRTLAMFLAGLGLIAFAAGRSRNR